MDPKTKNPTLEQKLVDASIDGAAVAFDPDEAEELGATADDMPEQDVIDAAFDDEV
jgi:hypothetical protein